jgi:hypothetical protein
VVHARRTLSHNASVGVGRRRSYAPKTTLFGLALAECLQEKDHAQPDLQQQMIDVLGHREAVHLEALDT